ncbi:MAG: glycosyltransferase family 4 protein [Cryomorphaceae bacterium]|nr:glycosyltransferase family 4 protein [Cryomorphaceae bacterium]
MVNTRLLIPGKLTGVEWFTVETLKRIVHNHPDVRFTFLFDRQYDEQFIFGKNVKPVKLSPQARHPILWYAWFEYAVKKAIDKHKPDVFLSPDGFLSLRSNIPQIAVIHDLNFVHNPERLPKLTGGYYRYFFAKYAERSTRIATVSEYSKNDIAETYNIPHDRIDVVYNGVSDRFFRMDEKPTIELTDHQPYFLFVGSLNPRKNIIGMLTSFEIFKNKSLLPHKLLIVGDQMFKLQETKSFYQNMQHREDVIFAGRRDGDDLNKLYNGADALWFVSHFEGFGIPIIEAFKAGCPVITANNTSMPEVAGDAALICEANDEKGIAEAMHRVVNDGNLRNSLIEKGIKRAEVFTWDKAAERLWACLKKTLTMTLTMTMTLVVG